MSFLLVKNTEFKEVINERIDIGQKLEQRQVLTSEQLFQLNEDVELWHDYNCEYLKLSFDNPNNEYKIEYSNAGYDFFGGLITENPNNLLLSKKDLISARINYLKRLTYKADLFKSYYITNKINVVSNKVKKETNFSKSEVFIVHGHDETAKTKTARFIEKLGFKPIILHEQASSGKTVIEKIEDFTNVGFGIVLYTPCDVGAKKEIKPNLQNRARQNVIFEHGFLIGKIGRNNVCALVKDDIEKPNDISGVVYIKMDEEDAWHLKLAKELRNSGYDVDLNKL